MIGRIKTGALKNDPNRCVYLVKRFLAAFGALGEWII